MLIRTRVGAAGFLIAALTFVGCQQSGNSAFPVTLSGKVTYNGSPVGGGLITVFTADGTPIQVPIGPDGSYLADNLPEGPVTVAVNTESVNPNKKTEDYRGQGGGNAAKYGMKMAAPSAAPKGGAPKSPAPEGAGGAHATYVKIPAKYANKETSGLSTTLKKGKQTYDISLTD